MYVVYVYIHTYNLIHTQLNLNKLFITNLICFIKYSRFSKVSWINSFRNISIYLIFYLFCDPNQQSSLWKMKIQLCGGCDGTHKTTANFGEMLYIIQTKYKQKLHQGQKKQNKIINSARRSYTAMWHTLTHCCHEFPSERKLRYRI